MKNQKKLMRWCAIALPSLVTVLAIAIAGMMYRRVLALENELKMLTTPAVEESASAGAETASSNACDAEQAETRVSQLEVERVEYSGDNLLRVVLNARPDMDVARNYISVEPMKEGIAGFRYDADYNYRRGRYESVVEITGEYAYRTNVTLTIRKGFPLYGKGANPNATGSLTNDFTYVFTRKDPAPSVGFADSGRYLPPGGRNALRLEAVSVNEIATSICRVEPRNIVQLLAREENVYASSSWWTKVDGSETEELAGECVTGVVKCVNRPCEKEIVPLPIAVDDGGSEHGVFLVEVHNNVRGARCNYRLVALSDLGLSVRKHKDFLSVWTASLTTGTPIEGARIEVYSSANILIAEGESDEFGRCEPKRIAKGEPFAVVVWTADDMSFMALSSRNVVDEMQDDGARDDYLKSGEVDAFLWTERGIYRHGEKIFVHALLRDDEGVAPAPMPLALSLVSPSGNMKYPATVVTDANGSLTYDGFSVPDEQPSGQWTLRACLPGAKGRVLAEREVKIEEFAPPQIRVKVSADEKQSPTNFMFMVSAEHLFGAPADGLACEGAVVFEDVPFAPSAWKGFTFGNEQLGLKPSFRKLSEAQLSADGNYVYEAPLWADSGRPKAAIRATGQGVVFEDGGRPATARMSVLLHYYPYYLGSNLPSWVKRPEVGQPQFDFVCVDKKGELIGERRILVAKLDRIDSVYSYREKYNGTHTWDCERISTTIFDELLILIDASGRGTFELPRVDCGDYVLTVCDRETGVSFARAFYLSDWGDDVVRAPLSNPTEVTLRTDKAFYRVGETPRLVVKSPFAGYAILAVQRDDVIYEEVLNLTNATSEVVLRPVERAWAPNVNVSLSVLQSVSASARHLAARAHGETTVRVRPSENEIAATLDAEVSFPPEKNGGSRVVVKLDAPGARAAVVTLVDEGINLLTGEPKPDPLGRFARERSADLPLYDLYGRILPVADDSLVASGVKTGGGFGAEMLGRVSPVPTRRFKPLALWNERVELTDGKGEVVFELPEFVGEVRVTALAYSDKATGVATVHKKVTPKLILQADAPRFIAPRDRFEATMTLRNRSGVDGEVSYEFSGTEAKGTLCLANGESTNLVFSCERGGALVFKAEGYGERHVETIELPVRPASAWHTKSEIVRLEPGETFKREPQGELHRFAVSVGSSPLAEYTSALDWLAAYPYGCLEQTSSQIFPLITAGGILDTLVRKASTNRAEYVAAGVRRVESMIRENDFVMWPDCDYAPWDREVSLYAAHFLVEADKAGEKLNPQSRSKVLKFLKKWAMSTNLVESVYACHNLSLAGCPDSDRMMRLYDEREQLDMLSRSRLARAFAVEHDLKRAEALMSAQVTPQSIKEASFRALALLAIDPEDARLPALIEYLTKKRDKERLSWGTTEENAHALLAIGAYYSHHPIKGGEVKIDAIGLNENDTLVVTNSGAATAFVSVRSKWVNKPEDEKDEECGIFLSRRYIKSDGTIAEPDKLVRGEMLTTELVITSAVTRVVSDLVIEDLFAGAFEPVHREEALEDWVMRKDARDDRMLVFSKQFELTKGHEAKIRYPVRVVSAGEYALPSVAAEGMYNPELRARCGAARIVVRH